MKYTHFRIILIYKEREKSWGEVNKKQAAYEPVSFVGCCGEKGTRAPSGAWLGR